jgi:DNA-binding NtrC family response regulator
VKLWIHFNQLGAPDNVLPEQVYDQYKKQNCKQPGSWELYRPDQLYIIPWKPDPKLVDLSKGQHTLDEVLSAYVWSVYEKLGRHKANTAKHLGIDRKTLYRYIDHAEDNYGAGAEA